MNLYKYAVMVGGRIFKGEVRAASMQHAKTIVKEFYDKNGGWKISNFHVQPT